MPPQKLERKTPLNLYHLNLDAPAPRRVLTVPPQGTADHAVTVQPEAGSFGNSALRKGFWNGIKSPALWARPQKSTMRWRAFPLRTYTTSAHLYALYALCAGHLRAFFNFFSLEIEHKSEISISAVSRNTSTGGSARPDDISISPMAALHLGVPQY